MCGRYALFGPHSRYRDFFETDEWPVFADRYNIAPSSSVPVIRQAPDGRRAVGLLRWGLVPHWAKDASIGAKLANARAESVADKPSFRAAYRKRRCLVPASGFYEWQERTGARKQPWFIHLKTGEPIALGGLWESWTGAQGDILRTFCLITTDANAVMAPIHDRMPVIVRPENWTAWLAPDMDPGRIAPLLAPTDPGAIEVWPVSRRVSYAREEGPDLIAPDPPASG